MVAAMVVMMTTMDTVMAMVLAPTSGLDEVLKECLMVVMGMELPLSRAPQATVYT